MDSNHWTGRFYSRLYPMVVHGTVKMTLRDINEPGYNTDFELSYSGVFRNGQSLTGVLDVQEDRMTSCIGEQRLSFQITTKTSTEITGDYKSVNPGDSGTFTLYHGDEQVLPAPVTCCLQ